MNRNAFFLSEDSDDDKNKNGNVDVDDLMK